MLGSQNDPIWILAMSQQRQAELIADVRHDELVQEALQFGAGRTARNENMGRGRVGRIANLVSAARQMRLLLAGSAVGLSLAMVATLAYAATQ